MKKIILCLIIMITCVPTVTLASSNTEASLNGKYYDKLEDAIDNANDGDKIKLFSNAELEKGIILSKNIEINLNNNTISAPTSVFEIRNGSLTLTGKGVIKETEPNYGAIKLIGSSDPNDKKYSIVSVGKDITLEGWSGIFVSHEGNKSYGVNVDLEGKINAVNDINGGTGIGVYVNGKIKDETSHPVVNIKDGAVITSTGDGLYIGGYSTFNIGKATISGIEAGIGIKSGILNIDGASISGTGPDFTPTEGYNNGIRASGTALQIESNTGYAGNMEINIKDGDFLSKNSFVIYEYIGKGSSTTVKKMNINAGKFVSNANKEALAFSDKFKSLHSKFVTGGAYSTTPEEFIASGYTVNKENNLYVVSKSVMNELLSGKDVSTNNSNNTFKIIIMSLISIILLIILYINRTKIIKIFQK